MANHVIDIRKVGDHREAKPSSVAIASGDTVTFNTGSLANSILRLSARTSALVSPAPPANAIELADQASVTLTLGDVRDGGYTILVESPGWSTGTSVEDDPATAGAVLTIRKPGPTEYPLPGEDPAGGNVPVEN